MFCPERSRLSYMFTPSQTQSTQMIYLAYANALSAEPLTLSNPNLSNATDPYTHTHACTAQMQTPAFK